MASPERIKNSQLFPLIEEIPPCFPVKNTIPHDIASTINVRIAVARCEFTPSMPIFASIEVSAAKTADSIA